MYCRKCGNELGNDVRFCQNCGTPVTIPSAQANAVPSYIEPPATTTPTQADATPDYGVPPITSAPIRRPTNRIIVPIVAAVGALSIGIIATYAILGTGRTSIARNSTGDIISKSPEEAAQAFVDAISSDDLESAIALFGCGRRAASLDFADYITRVGSWIPASSISRYPSSTNIFMNANQQTLRKEASDEICGLVFSLNADEAYLVQSPMQDNREGTLATEVVEYCSPENLDTFKILRMDYACPDVQESSTGMRNAQRQATVYGGETTEDYTILYEYDGKTYFGGMLFIGYDDGWYISTAYTLYGGQVAQGYLTEMSEREYIERIETSDWDIE